MEEAAEKSDRKIWCVCKSSLADDNMIACDYPKCEIEWYHWECVGLKEDQVPKGKWYCDQCKQRKRHEQAQKRRSSGGATKNMYICEFCDKGYAEKIQLIQHKASHYRAYSEAGFPISSSPLPGYHDIVNTRPPSSTPPLGEIKDVIKSEPVTPLKQDNLTPPLPSPGTSTGSRSNASTPSNNHGNRSNSGSNTPTTNGGRYSNFSDQEIVDELIKRGELFKCVCGVYFTDMSLYYIHRGSHDNKNPHKCSFCDYVSRSWYDFTAHFIAHKENPSVT